MNCWDDRDKAMAWFRQTRVPQYVKSRQSRISNGGGVILSEFGYSFDKLHGITFEVVDELLQIEEYAIQEFLILLPEWFGEYAWFEKILAQFLCHVNIPLVELHYGNSIIEVLGKKRREYSIERLNKCTWRITPRFFLFDVGLPLLAHSFLHLYFWDLTPWGKLHRNITNVYAYYSLENVVSSLTDYAFFFKDGREFYITNGRFLSYKDPPKYFDRVIGYIEGSDGVYREEIYYADLKTLK